MKKTSNHFANVLQRFLNSKNLSTLSAAKALGQHDTMLGKVLAGRVLLSVKNRDKILDLLWENPECVGLDFAAARSLGLSLAIAWLSDLVPDRYKSEIEIAAKAGLEAEEGDPFAAAMRNLYRLGVENPQIADWLISSDAIATNPASTDARLAAAAAYRRKHRPWASEPTQPTDANDPPDPPPAEAP